MFTLISLSIKKENKMKNRAKSNIISIRLDEETYSRLLKAEKKYQKPISTMVRNFIETMLINLENSENEYIEKQMKGIFDVMEIDEKIIMKLEGQMYSIQSDIQKTLSEIEAQAKIRALNRTNLFSNI